MMIMGQCTNQGSWTTHSRTMGGRGHWDENYQGTFNYTRLHSTSNSSNVERYVCGTWQIWEICLHNMTRTVSAHSFVFTLQCT